MKIVDTKYDTIYNRSRRYLICQSGINYYRVFTLGLQSDYDTKA